MSLLKKVNIFRGCTRSIIDDENSHDNCKKEGEEIKNINTLIELGVSYIKVYYKEEKLWSIVFDSVGKNWRNIQLYKLVNDEKYFASRAQRLIKSNPNNSFICEREWLKEKQEIFLFQKNKKKKEIANPKVHHTYVQHIIQILNKKYNGEYSNVLVTYSNVFNTKFDFDFELDNISVIPYEELLKRILDYHTYDYIIDCGATQTTIYSSSEIRFTSEFGGICVTDYITKICLLTIDKKLSKKQENMVWFASEEAKLDLLHIDCVEVVLKDIFEFGEELVVEINKKDLIENFSKDISDLKQAIQEIKNSNIIVIGKNQHFLRELIPTLPMNPLEIDEKLVICDALN